MTTRIPGERANKGCDKRAAGVVSAGKRKGGEGKQGVAMIEQNGNGRNDSAYKFPPGRVKVPLAVNPTITRTYSHGMPT
jgi:hypothetical protein